MTVTLNLPPHDEETLRARARQEGMEISDYILTLARRAAEAARRQSLAERNQAANTLLDKFLNTDEYGTAEEQRETLEHLRVALDANRPGQRSIFGEGFNPMPDEHN